MFAMKAIHRKTDVILIGGGIMSATLGTLLKRLSPEKEITVFEKLDAAAKESSNVWNNAGTGHAALCELNYTSENADGQMDIAKAVKINEQFQVSKQFWAYLTKVGHIDEPEAFVRSVPHMSFVEGVQNVAFLKKRVAALHENVLFRGMALTEDAAKMREWAPLMMEGRKQKIPMALTYDASGTDVNFGALTNKLFDYMAAQEHTTLKFKHDVRNLTQQQDGSWEVVVKDLEAGKTYVYQADFVFIGAGGASLPLLQKTGLPESKHIGGFPVSGIFLTCNKQDIVEQHHGKVYGKAKVGAPPMSVPHLDTRFIDGKKALLFGPFAGFSPKFLKTGSHMDLLGSVKPNNVFTMLAAGAKELGLTKYLVSQLMLSHEARVEDLRAFVPTARKEDWDVVVAGQRVQVIKDTKDKGKGTLQFGTEVITSQDGTLSALLGASPGASTAVDVMLDILSRCFKTEMPTWEAEIKEMVPSYGQKLSDDEALFKRVNKANNKALKLTEA